MTSEEHYQQLLDLIRGRRSHRRFGDGPVARASLERVLEAGRWAPSAGNRQAYRFCVVSSPETIASMAEAVRRATARLTEKARPDLKAETRDYVQAFDHFEAAPIVLVPIFRCGVDLLEPEAPSGGARPARSVIDAVSSVSAAIMNVVLAAHALGLAACWMTGPLVAAEQLREILDVPAGWEMAAVIPIGTRDDEPEPPSRRSLSKLVRTID